MQPQTQSHQPGKEYKMNPQPKCDPIYPGVGKFEDQVVIVTGGDSGIGRATALSFANEGANLVIVYKDEDTDARETKDMIQDIGTRCVLLKGDLGEKSFCEKVVAKTMDAFGRIDVLVNNAGEQHTEENFEEISEEQIERTFKTNLFSYFYMIQASLPHIKRVKGSIINNASVTAYQGHSELVDYSSTKGGIVALTRSLSQSLAEDGVRVNAVAPGPIWTPLIPASFDEEHVKSFGENTPLGRAGQPNEVAGCFTFLASNEASYITGQVLHPNGGKIVGS